jgi:hypothetical protein
LLGVAAVLLAGFVFFSSDSEPEYEGKSLSGWCEQIIEKHPPDEKAMRAVRSIGTNAIPWLLKDLNAKGHAWHWKANQILEKQKLVKWRFPDVDRQVRRACWGMFALGDMAKHTIPELERMLVETPGYVPWVLVGMGHEAVPSICRALTNGHQYVESNMAVSIANVTSFGRLKTDDLKTLLPIMQQQGNSTNAHVKARTLEALQFLKSNGILEGELAKFGDN